VCTRLDRAKDRENVQTPAPAQAGEVFEQCLPYDAWHQGYGEELMDYLNPVEEGLK